MPTFSFAVVSKKTTNKAKQYTSNIIKRGVSEVIKLTSDGSFFITHEGIDYPLSRQSYKCEGHPEIFSIQKLSNKHIIKYIREKINSINVIGFLPFAPGDYIKGNIAKNLITKELEFQFNKLDDKLPNVEIRKNYIENFNKYTMLINERLKKFK